MAPSSAAGPGRRGRRQLPRQPRRGLMIWTLLVFGSSMFLVLRKVAFPRIAEALDKRQRAIEESIDTAERARAEADELLDEYRERLREARGRPTRSSPAPARPARSHERETLEEARAKREEMMEQTRRDIEAETRRAIQEIRAEVADLTVLATEKVTRKTLDEADQQRLVEEALAELDFAALARGAAATSRWRRSPRSTPARCSRSPRSRTSSTSCASSSAQFADALDEYARAADVLLLAVLLDRGEAGRPGQGGLRRRPDDRQLPQAADREPPDAGASSACGASTTGSGRRRTSSCRSRSRRAVELDQATVQQHRRRIAEQTGRKVELTANVDPDILGGIVVRVGNSILDASIRNRLENLRKQVVKA